MKGVAKRDLMLIFPMLIGNRNDMYKQIFTPSDGNRLAKSGGSFPYTKELAPGEEVSFEIACTGQGESSGEDDIVVNGTFTENETGETLAAEDRMTVVRVDFIPQWQASENSCMRRHKVGVREEIGCVCQPNLQNVEWRNVGNGVFDGTQYICSLDAEEMPIKVLYKNVEYTPLISVVAPNGIEARKVDYWKDNVPTNSAGGIGLTMDLYVKPLDVSFEGIAVEEVPCNEGSHTGYFAFSCFSGDWYHSRDNGAGNWINVRSGNLWGEDKACISNALSRITEDGILVDDENYSWIDGELVWHVPFGWNESDTTEKVPEFARFAEDTRQIIVIFSSGLTGVEKFGNRVIRYIDGRIYLNNRRVE